MKLLHRFEEPSDYRGGYVSIGNFDGVHRGHQSMISTLVRRAGEDRVPAVVFTFDPHPIQILRPGQAPVCLSTLERKAELLAEIGVDFVIAYPTDRALLNLTPLQFFETIVLGELGAKGLVEGPNFFFGHDRAGDISTLQKLCTTHGLTLEVVPPARVGDRYVSSSVVRSRIADGDIAEAVDLLGHPYRVHGRVVAGSGRGRTLEFPTANLVDVPNLLPPDGVYAGVGRVAGQAYPAAINLGPNPTFGEQQRKLEVHLVGFAGDLYGQSLAVDVLARVRDVCRFANVEDLRRQVKQDIETVRSIVSSADR